jgi:hypothetical protein
VLYSIGRVEKWWITGGIALDDMGDADLLAVYAVVMALAEEGEQ